MQLKQEGLWLKLLQEINEQNTSNNCILINNKIKDINESIIYLEN